MRAHFVIGTERSPAYAAMARLAAWSIRRRAGTLANSRVTVVFNDTADDSTVDFLRASLDVDALALPRVSQGMPYLNKYTALNAPNLKDSDWIILLDVDTAIVNSLDPLLNRFADPALDFLACPVLDARVWGFAPFLARETGLPLAEIESLHHPWCPAGRPYFNGGFFALRAQHLKSFREPLVPLGEKYFRMMRAAGPNPWRWIRAHWNRLASRAPSTERFVIRPHFSKVYADQLSLLVSVLRNRLRFEILPHTYNWREENAGQGEDSPIRILHYLRARFPEVDRAYLFDPNSDWLASYRSSPNPGRRALADLIDNFNREFPPSPVVSQSLAHAPQAGASPAPRGQSPGYLHSARFISVGRQ